MTVTGLTTCERHGKATALRCGRCERPICPRCSVVTDVGQRCLACAAGPRRKLRTLGPGQKWPVALAVAAGVGVVGVGLFVWFHRNSGTTTIIPPGQQVAAYRTINNTSADYSLEIPSGWVPASDNTASTFSYTDSQQGVGVGSVHVSIAYDTGTLSDHVALLISALQAQGGQGFSQMPEMISGLAAIRLDYRLPLSPNARARLASHTTYLVKRDSASVVSFQLATTNPTAEMIVFDHMEASFAIPR